MLKSPLHPTSTRVDAFNGAMNKVEEVKIMSGAQKSIKAQETGNHTSLMSAALEGKTQEVKELLSKGAAVNAKDGAGRTALMFAVINLHRDTVKVLLEHGADVNASANDGGTALMLAAVCGDEKIVHLLLTSGATVNATFVSSGLTAIKLATLKGFSHIVQLLQRSEPGKYQGVVSKEQLRPEQSGLQSNQVLPLPTAPEDTNIA